MLDGAGGFDEAQRQAYLEQSRADLGRPPGIAAGSDGPGLQRS